MCQHVPVTQTVAAPPTAPHPPVRLRHRPALDGLRGFAVGACLLYQTFTSVLTGAWIGVDMFLVLSGFFIAAMLLREQRKWGSIDYLEFLRRRARRLLPTQLFMLGVVVVLSFFWVVPGRRLSVAWDVVASAFQFVNWRFILSDQSYFANLSLPTPVRHMWSLNVQEQFYVVFPFVIAILFAITRKRWVRIALLLGLAGLSVTRMAMLYVPGTDPSRVYYGTDTRIFEVIIGVVAAFLISERSFAMGEGRAHQGWLDRWDKQIGWAGLASMAILTVLMVTISEYSAIVFQGGLVLVCLLTLVAIVAASGPHSNVLQRILSWKPLQRVGVMGYSLYIWHWPALVFTMFAIPNTPLWFRHTVAMVATVVVGRWAYKHIEEPAHRRGLKALLPGKPHLRKIVVVGALPAVLFGAWGLSTASGPQTVTDLSRNVTLAIPTYRPATETTRVVLLGNSVALGVATDRGSGTPDLDVTAVTSFGCDPFAAEMVRSGTSVPLSEDCKRYQMDWPKKVAAADADVVAFFLPINLLADYTVGGQVLVPGTPAHDKFVVEMLEGVRDRALASGAGTFVLNNLSCHEREDYFGNEPTIGRSNDVSRVRHLNALAGRWAQNSEVRVIDTFDALCPDGRAHTSLNGVEMFSDGLHFTTDAVPIYWEWLAPQIREAANRTAPVP